jgi:hypothetical protein
MVNERLSLISWCRKCIICCISLEHVKKSITSESICIIFRGNYRKLEWVKTVQINVLEAYVNVEQKGLFYGTLSLFMKVYEFIYDVSSIIPKLKSSWAITRVNKTANHHRLLWRLTQIEEYAYWMNIGLTKKDTALQHCLLRAWALNVREDLAALSSFENCRFCRIISQVLVCRFGVL